MGNLAASIGDSHRVPDVSRYRKIQLLDAVNKGGRKYTLKLFDRLSFSEKVWVTKLIILRKLRKYRTARRMQETIDRLYSPYLFHPPQAILNFGSYTKNSEVYAAIENGDIVKPL
jgi:hypothetical protein